MGKRDCTTAPRKGERASKRLKRESPSPVPSDLVPALAAGKRRAVLRHPLGLEYVNVPADAPYPSPYANVDELRDEMHDQYDAAIARAGPLISRCLQQQMHMDAPEFEDDDSRPFVRWFRASGTGGGNVEKGYLTVRQLAQETRVGDFARISLDDQVSPIRPRRRFKTNAPKPQRALEIHREDKDGEAAVEYYLRWRHGTKVVVNGQCYDDFPGMVGDVAIGPLPDYAIIEIEQNVVFWWKNEHGLAHIPHRSFLELKHRHQWHKIWQSKFFIHKAALSHARDRAAGREQSPPCHIESSANVFADKVYLGIAAVWKALRDSGTVYAFNGDVENQQIRYNTEGDEEFFASGYGATVDGPRPLVLPLVYDFDNVSQPSSAIGEHFIEEKSAPKQSWGNGHTLFAFVERRADNVIT
ncbi:MAG: hypothetical protein Q9183_005542, partial [Haloplaca sp. 2 TL-2023]